MIRGVNKNVIEISDTGNECFERAILFVRAGSAEGDGEQLRQRARQYLSGLRLRPRIFRKPRWKTLLWGLAFAFSGAGIAALFFLL